MAKRETGTKEYYAVVNGRLDEPTIFSSWGDVHPRVTGCTHKYKGFRTIEQARAYMNAHGVKQPKQVIKEGAGNTGPIRNRNAFYAAANGRTPGIYPYWHGDIGVDQQVDKASGACHRSFRTEEQAQAFIEDWKQCFADVCRVLIKQELDRGSRPLHMNLEAAIAAVFKQEDAGDIHDLGVKKFGQLSIKEE